MQPRTKPALGSVYPEFAANALFDQLPWIFQRPVLPPKLRRPAPNVHAHLSAFSAPLWSYQPAPRGSVSSSDSSWPDTFPSAASPWLCPEPESSGSQPGSPSRLKKNPNWTFTPLQVPQLCHAQ